eukprot:SAG31_NODE_25147_length_467_cov_0.777174_1_plen_70_part_01
MRRCGEAEAAASEVIRAASDVGSIRAAGVIDRDSAEAAQAPPYRSHPRFSRQPVRAAVPFGRAAGLLNIW